jgi:ribosome-binding protein aMBF1 (putative translation factor)
VTKRATPAPKAAAKKAVVPRVNEDVQVQVYVGNRIKELREAAGMRQEDLAKLVEMVQPKLPAIEQGRRDIHISTLRRFAKALGVNMRDLIPPD